MILRLREIRRVRFAPGVCRRLTMIIEVRERPWEQERVLECVSYWEVMPG